MEKYSRYTDSNQRLWVLIERRASIEIKGKDISCNPTSVTLLNVHAESTQVLNYTDFEKFVNEGRFKRIEKTT